MYPILGMGEYRVKTIKELVHLAEDPLLQLTKQDRSALKDLASAVRDLPNDNYLDPPHYLDTVERINTSIPFEEGTEPFACLVVARKILRDELESAGKYFNGKI